MDPIESEEDKFEYSVTARHCCAADKPFVGKLATSLTFLCNSCGFCEYAKFGYSVTARLCCAVDPIESEEHKGQQGSVSGVVQGPQPTTHPSTADLGAGGSWNGPPPGRSGVVGQRLDPPTAAPHDDAEGPDHTPAATHREVKAKPGLPTTAADSAPGSDPGRAVPGYTPLEVCHAVRACPSSKVRPADSFPTITPDHPLPEETLLADTEEAHPASHQDQEELQPSHLQQKQRDGGVHNI